MAHGLADGPSDEYDVRNTEHGLSAKEVAQHTGNQATKECAKRGRGCDEFLLCLLAACSTHDFCSPYLLTRRQFCRPEVTSNRYESTRDNPRVVTCDQQNQYGCMGPRRGDTYQRAGRIYWCRRREARRTSSCAPRPRRRPQPQISPRETGHFRYSQSWGMHTERTNQHIFTVAVGRNKEGIRTAGRLCLCRR